MFIHLLWKLAGVCNSSYHVTILLLDEGACLPPEITNGNFLLRKQGWYPHGHKIWVTCVEGYEHHNNLATAQCSSGTWSTLPVCTSKFRPVERLLSVHLSPCHRRKCPSPTEPHVACDEPPRIPHAAVINQGHREVFADGSQVQYQCKEGYTVEGESTDKKSIICIGGRWTDVPTCSKWKRCTFP